MLVEIGDCLNVLITPRLICAPAPHTLDIVNAIFIIFSMHGSEPFVIILLDFAHKKLILCLGSLRKMCGFSGVPKSLSGSHKRPL